jgi:gliding motility-associated-like protein
MVHNPGFEDYSTCPTSYGQVTNHCNEWADPTGATSDYYRSTPCNFGIPVNVYGSQTPYEGNGYIGLSQYYGANTNVKEYIQGNTDPLQINSWYRVVIHVSKGDNAPSASDGLQVFFYRDGYTPPILPQQTIPANPQIDYNSYGIITEDSLWLTLADTFQADSDYTHLIIGTFEDVANINATGPNYSYYYIDYVDIEEIFLGLHTSDSQTNVTCNGGSNGSATVTASGGTAPYTYLWSPGNQTTATITGLAAGSYTCRVIDATPDTVLDTIVITEPPVLTATTSQTNVSCNGGSDGTATVSVSGGTTPYTYSWAPAGGNNATATGLSAGNYTCTITDSNGCSLQEAFTITQPPPLTATTSQVNILCNGNTTGSATVNVSGGTPGYTYAWAPTGGNNPTATGLTAGNYTCTVTDANGCTLQQSFTLTQPTALAATTTQNNITCNGDGDGAASVSVSGGVAPYTYSWAPYGGNAANASGLVPGTYTCTITDANNCVLTKTFTITEPALLAVSIAHTDVTCYGAGNGSATATPSGGTAPYTYSWAPSGGNNATATGLTGGTYTCTVTDAHGCTASQSVTIIQPAQQLSVFASQTNLLCNGASTGLASVIISGGTAPYTYSWAPSGGNSPVANNLTAGNYTCTITDAHSCSITQAFTLTEPAPIVSTNSHADILCHGNTNGIATVLVSGGIAPYTYSWAPTGGNAPNATGLSAGTYTCTITDHNNCIHTETVTISEPAALTVVDSQANITCFGDADGYAQVSVSGGTTPYTYAWAPAGGNGNAASALTAGTYSCTISDYNNCNHTEVFNITQPPALSAHTSKTNVVCQNLNQGMAIAVAQGGTPPYTYLWTPGNTTDTIISGLGIGMDTCTISDANGCTYAVIFHIVDTSQPFSYSITDSALGCRTALLDAIPGAGSSTATSYLWLFADSSSGTDNPAIHTFPQSGPNSTALVLVNAVGCHDTLNYNFSINYPMVADFSFDPNPPLANTQVHFYNASSPYASLFNWDFGDGTSSAQENPDKSYNDSGSYTICLIASDTNNCVDTACKDISIDVTKSIGVPSAFSPNGDGVNDVLYVRGYRIKAFRLRIYNRWGNLVFETDNKVKGWDGTYKGAPQVEETYAYTLEATFTDGSTIQKAGSISLLR